MLMALAAGVTAVSNSPITSLRRAAGATDAAAPAELLHRLALDASLVDADCDESGRSALHHACWRGSVRNVERLLDLGCDIDAWSTGEPAAPGLSCPNPATRHRATHSPSPSRTPSPDWQACTRTARLPSSTPPLAAATTWSSFSSLAAPACAS
jgi:hypothetical protein